MKKFLFIVGIVVITAIVFTGGFFVGTHLDFLSKFFFASLFEKEIADVSTTFMVIKQLDEGKIDEAKSFLNLKLDGHIISINTLLPNCPNEESKVMANKMLACIGHHRSKYPESPSATFHGIERKEIDTIIQKILDEAIAEKEKTNIIEKH